MPLLHCDKILKVPHILLTKSLDFFKKTVLVTLNLFHYHKSPQNPEISGMCT